MSFRPSDQQSDLGTRIAGRLIRNHSRQFIALTIQVERGGNRENRHANRGDDHEAGERLGAGHAVYRHAAYSDDDRDACEDAPHAAGFRIGHGLLRPEIYPRGSHVNPAEGVRLDDTVRAACSCGQPRLEQQGKRDRAADRGRPVDPVSEHHDPQLSAHEGNLYPRVTPSPPLYPASRIALLASRFSVLPRSGVHNFQPKSSVVWIPLTNRGLHR